MTILGYCKILCSYIESMFNRCKINSRYGPRQGSINNRGYTTVHIETLDNY